MAAAAEIRPALFEAGNPQAARPFSDNPEFDLLLACCTGLYGNASYGYDSYGHDSFGRDLRIRRILSRPLDWKRMLGLVDHHRVVPQVYGQLSALSNLVPGHALDPLRSRYQDNARKALWFTGELARVLNHLEAAGIKALPFKGPILAETLYGEVTHRQFGDLDILILPADVSKAKATLLGVGHSCEPDLRPSEEPAYVGSGCGYVFHSPAGRNLLDLQWRMAPRFYCFDFDIAAFFDRAGEISVAGRAMPTLAAEDLLLVLCVHAAKHLWVQLSWLCDIAQLAKSRQLDWNAIQENARRMGIERIVSLNLFFAHKLLGAVLAPQIQNRVRNDSSTSVLANEILSIIERSVPYDTESMPYFRLMMRLRERRLDRARFLWRLALTPSVSEWSAVRLPKPLHPLYHLVRLSRLAKRLRPRSPEKA